jgi:NADH pyrophosphatase NudC (nudix superfamily)
VEVVEKGRSTGDLMAIQVKTGYGSKRRTDGSYNFDITDSSAYWLAFCLPVLLVVVEEPHDAWSESRRPPIRWERVHSDTIVVEDERCHLVIGAHRLLTRESQAELMHMAMAHKDQKRRLADAQGLLDKLRRRFVCPGCGALMYREDEGSGPGPDDHKMYDIHAVEYECGRLVINDVVVRQCGDHGDDSR